jgi:CTP:molybdopterin cytidylyltransferase MocA
MTPQPDSPPTQKPTLVIFLGNLGTSPVERMVGGARRAAAFDTIEAAISTRAFDHAILATDEPCDQDLPAELELDVDDADFHFGRRLSDLIRRHDLEPVLYLGAGSVPLFGPEDFRDLAASLRDDTAITNNAFSSDLVAFLVREGVLKAIAPLDRDNALARALEERTGLTLRELPRTVATQMDIDGPSDLAILALTGEGGPRLRDYLRSFMSEPDSTGQALSMTAYQRVLPLLTDREAQIVVAGRVGSHSWQYLERETACRVRLFAEERGLESDDRAATGTARSLVGFFIDVAGIDRLFEVLPQLGDAALIDTRVLLAHKRIDATREDRFLSDRGDWKNIRQPFLRDFTRAATEAVIPVLLGGHSLMSGGLMALNEHAWRHHDATHSTNPTPPSS